MRTTMFLEVLRAFETLPTRRARIRLQRCVDANVAGYVIALGVACLTSVPGTCKAQVVFTVAHNVVVTQVAVQRFSIVAHSPTIRPQALQGLVLAALRWVTHVASDVVVAIA